MRQIVLLAGLLGCVFSIIVNAQNQIVPRPPFTAQDAERGDQLRAKSDQIRAEMTKMGNMESLLLLGVSRESVAEHEYLGGIRAAHFRHVRLIFGAGGY